MQHLEVCCAVRHIYMSLGFKRFLDLLALRILKWRPHFLQRCEPLFVMYVYAVTKCSVAILVCCWGQILNWCKPWLPAGQFPAFSRV